MDFERNEIKVLRRRLDEVPQFMIVVAGPRQVGKTTMVRQALAAYPSTFVAADQPSPEAVDPFSAEAGGALLHRASVVATPTAAWLVHQWEQARAKAKSLPGDGAYVLAIDEIQKVPRWSEVVKGLWDADRANGLALHVVLLDHRPGW